MIAAIADVAENEGEITVTDVDEVHEVVPASRPAERVALGVKSTAPKLTPERVKLAMPDGAMLYTEP